MSDEFKFRALTSEDWKGIADESLTDEAGLRLKEYIKDGFFISKPIDSGIVGCRWHRIVLDADIRENSTLTVSFYSTEDKEGAEKWSEPIVFKKARDALVHAPPRRYIKLKIDFHREEGEESPVLKQVKLYYPRLSYLRYLPAVYQEDSASKEFLERFLSIFESALHDSEETISRIPTYFDPMATQAEFVPWLASWLSLDLYELLEEEDKNREFILRAVEFYKQKGTVSGIAALVSFLTGKKCCVKEYRNNVFRSYGMEHDEEDEIVDISEYMRECTNYIEDPKFYVCTKFHHRTSKTVDTGYLFSWGSVPGDDNERLLRFLKDDHDIDWAENVEISKSDDRKTISISNGEHSIEIIMDEKNKKATLKISDGRTHNLKVKKEDDKLNIYDTGTLDLLANMGKYCDEVHYVIDTSKDGRYSPHVIGLFIFLDAGEKLIIDEEELHKIINTFLPVFVRAEIIAVEGPFKEEYDISWIIEEYNDTIHSFWEEEYKDVCGIYKDSVNWKWLYAYSAEHTDIDITNNVDYRTPHSKIGVDIPL
ncbi:MAG: hypothetical protein KAT65_18130 [Methanophagales archaeon]|nr:hypothetical protein [Methanophagales archaeon]